MTVSTDDLTPAAESARPFRFNLDSAVDLLLRPERFFRAYLDARPKDFPLLAIWIVGMAAVIDRLDTRMMMAEARGTAAPLFVESMTSSWLGFWLYVTLGGVLAGVITYWILGWWYLVRLGFSGATLADSHAARRVYTYARLVWSFPVVLSVLLIVPLYDNYLDVSNSGAFALVWVMAPVWSTFVGYRGAMGCFKVDPVKARFWFLVLPLGVLGLAFGLGALLVL